MKKMYPFFLTFLLMFALTAAAQPPKATVSVKVKQCQFPTAIGDDNQEIICVKIYASDATTTLTQMNLTMAGSTSTGDVSLVKVFYGGKNYRFNPAGTLFGTAAPGSGTLTINGSQALQQDTNYFWVAYNVASTATEGNVLDAVCSSVIVSGTTYNPTNVSGTRTIFLTHATLYRCKDAGSLFYRIPGIITAPDGSLVTAVDKRWNGSGDLANDIDVLIRRSTDKGETWSAPLTIAGSGTTTGYGDPTLCVDHITGDIICLMAQGPGLWSSTSSNPIRIYKCVSSDNGISWTAPTDITSQIYASGCSNTLSAAYWAAFVASGKFIQLSNGRLAAVVAARKTSATSLDNHVIYSDDHGVTWGISTLAAYTAGDEAKLVELTSGSTLISIRHSGNRIFNTSADNGITWGTAYAMTSLVEPACNGDILRYTRTDNGSDKNRLLHSIPNNASTRKNVSVFLSTDEGSTWPTYKTIYPLGSAYSCLTALNDGSIGIFFEADDTCQYEQIHYVRFSLNWLSSGSDSWCYVEPPVVTSNGPQCEGTGVSFEEDGCPSGCVCYWQTSPTGTDMSNSDPTYTTPATPGTYTMYLRAYGCAWSKATAVTGTVYANPSAVSATASQSTICSGESIDLIGAATANSDDVVNFTEAFTTFPLAGWTMLNMGHGKDWGFSSSTYHNAAKSLCYGANSQTANAWAISPGLALKAGTTYTVSFWYRSTASNAANLKLTVGTANTSAAQTTVLWSVTGSVITTFQQITQTYTPTADGTYYFGLQCTSAGSKQYLFVDDFSVSGTKSNTATYSWTSDPAGFSSALQNPAGVVSAASTTYILTATNTNGCSLSDSVTVTVDDCTGLEEGSDQPGLIYPNPTTGKAYINTGTNKVQRVELSDPNGKVLFTSVDGAIATTGGVTEIDLRNLAYGMYYVRISDANRTLVFRVLKQN